MYFLPSPFFFFEPMPLYFFLMTLLLPFFVVVWLFEQAIAGNKNWQTRIGLYPIKLRCHLWIHAVSLGEVNTIIPLIERLKAKWPQARILLTSNTKTGLAQARKQIVARYSSVIACHPPYDLPFFIRRFIRVFAPRQVIIMEADLWPAILRYSGQRGIPRLLINARLPRSSLNKRKRFSAIFLPIDSMLDLVCAQTAKDANNFIALGMKKEDVKVCGNLKFDVRIPRQSRAYGMQLRSLIGKSRKVWVAASTHKGEEEAALVAHRRLLAAEPHSLMILVPRHPARFNRVANICSKSGLGFVRLSQATMGISFSQPEPHFTKLRQLELAKAQVLLADTLNDLLLLYASADLAFVGGSLVNKGGHNILEPAQLGLPIILGPHTDNLTGILPALVQTGGVLQVRNADELASAVQSAMNRPPAVIKEEFRQALMKHQGVAKSLMKYIDIAS